MQQSIRQQAIPEDSMTPKATINQETNRLMYETASNNTNVQAVRFGRGVATATEARDLSTEIKELADNMTVMTPELSNRKSRSPRMKDRGRLVM